MRVVCGLRGADGAEDRRAKPLGNRVIPTVRMAFAAVALFLDVVHVAIRRQFPVAADDAAAGERREAEEPNKVTHDVPL